MGGARNADEKIAAVAQARECGSRLVFQALASGESPTAKLASLCTPVREWVAKGLQRLRRAPCRGEFVGRIIRSHRLSDTGGLIWCQSCCAHSRRVTRTLGKPFKVVPRSLSYGSVLARLQQGLTLNACKSQPMRPEPVLRRAANGSVKLKAIVRSHLCQVRAEVIVRGTTLHAAEATPGTRRRAAANSSQHVQQVIVTVGGDMHRLQSNARSRMTRTRQGVSCEVLDGVQKESSGGGVATPLPPQSLGRPPIGLALEDSG